MARKKPALVAKREESKLRPPVVVVLGHVDHGKTTLLDKIRQTNIVASEAGGITQRIGACQIKLQTPDSKLQTITFIDTPGHTAFSKMRSRGAKVADLVVLAVAVDEGVKPQTLESLKHIQLAKIPYLVALTKIDLPDTNVERVKKDLGKNGVMIEGHGGDIVAVPVSGKTGEGIKDLLEMILILAEMAELKGSPGNPLQGVVIESKLDTQRGSLATILIRDGSLKVGDQVEIEGKVSKIRAMLTEDGKKVSLAGPSAPVEVFGFKAIPPIGAKVVIAKAQDEQKRKPFAPAREFAPLPFRRGPAGKDGEAETRRLKIVLKADTAGSLEAVVNSLPAEVQIVDSGVGAVGASDVLLAEATEAQIIAFNTRVSSTANKLATAEKVEISSFKVIYELLKVVEEKVLKLLEPTVGEKVLGRAEILKEFGIHKDRIVGCRVIEGEIRKVDRLHLVRKGKIVDDCRISSMKSGREDIEEVKKGEEFGAILSPSLDFRIGDMLISFRKVEEF